MRARASYRFLAASLVLSACYVGRSYLTAEILQICGLLAALGAMLVGLRRNRTKHPVAWYIFASSLVLFLAEHVCWMVNVVNGDMIAGPIGEALDFVGYLALLVGAVVALRQRTRRDAGGVLDAAVFAVAGGTMIWEFGMLARLTAWHASVPVFVVSLTQMLIVVAGLGVLVRLALTVRNARAALCFMFAALSGGFVQVVVFPLVSSESVHYPGSLVESFGLLAVMCVGTTALHPSMAQLTEPGPEVTERLSAERLLMLGGATMTAPISVGIWQLLGHPADSVLLVGGAIAIVPLVLYRIRGLVLQRATAESALAHQATHDSLTGLPNRVQFVGLLESALHDVRAGGSPQVAVLFCDLDGFKTVNDTLGHSAGDHLLIAVGQRLQDCVRAGDTVSRFGGDEFLILCQGNDPGEVAARIVTDLQRPVTLGHRKVTIAASIGIAAATAGGDRTAEKIIHDADVAMYAAKQAGAILPRLDHARAAAA
ncbi:MAG: hypothetical protein DLM59_05455 [Pseudonocardiales bacterium]|nr:MAG: hypothetical protein DLM59_05455 [Pseudonocardiales bacterium]